MNENKLSARMQGIVESAIHNAIKVACEMRQCFRLDVRIHAVTVIDTRPLCVNLRLISTQKEATRFTVHPIRDRYNRVHFPSVMLMDDGPNKEDLCVMFNSEYPPLDVCRKDHDWLKFTQTVKYPRDVIERSETLMEAIVNAIVQFLTRGIFGGQPYPGFQPA